MKCQAEILWHRQGQAFTDNRYTRRHLWKFDGGVEVPASSSPHVVPIPMSDAAAVDPEEAFVASISSCHMLWFLSIAAKRGYVVENYSDNAEGTMDKSSTGKVSISQVVLRPHLHFVGSKSPTVDEYQSLHREAHENCFIANSVRSEVCCEPTLEFSAGGS